MLNIPKLLVIKKNEIDISFEHVFFNAMCVQDINDQVSPDYLPLLPYILDYSERFYDQLFYSKNSVGEGVNYTQVIF